MVHKNKRLLQGARVLDLASHDGRWSIAALENGAAAVVGIEHKPGLVKKSNENFEHYGVPKEKYEFVCGDIFEHIDQLGKFDVVFCFGIFYHVVNHMLLLSKIAALEPRVLIMDTNVSQLDGDVIELMFEAVGGSVLVGAPTKSALARDVRELRLVVRVLRVAGLRAVRPALDVGLLVAQAGHRHGHLPAHLNRGRPERAGRPTPRAGPFPAPPASVAVCVCRPCGASTNGQASPR